MVHEPLMLNDTAMVLLRECAALDDEGEWFRSQLNASPWNDRDAYRVWAEWNTTHGNTFRLFNLQHELMHEIWLLWTFQDIPILRYLEWHLVLDASLMNVAEKTFLLPEDYRYSPLQLVTKTTQGSTWFITQLIPYYKNTLRTLAPTKM